MWTTAPTSPLSTASAAYPPLIFFKNGQPVDQIVGAVPKGRLKQKIDDVLSD